MNLETKITIYNFTPSGFYVDPQSLISLMNGTKTNVPYRISISLCVCKLSLHLG